MSIILTGADFKHFSGSYTIVTTTSRFDSRYSHWCMAPSVSSPPATTFAGGAAPTDWWLHCVYNLDDGYYGNYNIIVFKSGGTDAYALRTASASNNDFQLCYYDGGWIPIPETTKTLNDDTNYVLDIHFAPDGTTGVAEFYVNGVLVGAVTGNYIAATGASVDSVTFSSHYLNDSRRCHISELVVTSGGEKTIGWHVSTRLPNAAGTTGDWTGAYTDIDDTAADATADYIESDTDTNLSLFDFEDLDTSLSASLVKTVFLYADIEKATGSAVTNIDFVARPALTNYDGSNTGALTDDTETTEVSEFSINPETSIAWTLSAFNDSEFGYRANT